jgi:hypoxanthine phosphoribosyltransferase
MFNIHLWQLFFNILLFMTTIHDKHFISFLDQHTIEERIALLGKQISNDYQGRKPVLVVVLNGAFMFAAQLMKSIDIPIEIVFIRVSSYYKSESSGKVKEILGLTKSLKNEYVIVVEDIVDTGLTMVEIIAQITSQNPASLEVATLLHKPTVTQVPLRLKYVGFEVENKFVIGYGLDYDQLGRNLPCILQVSE